MKLAMIDSDYVGPVSGVHFANFGPPAGCIDKGGKKIAHLNHEIRSIYNPSDVAQTGLNHSKSRENPANPFSRT